MNITKDLKHLIIIEEPVNKFDNSGGYKKQWISRYQTWAKIESLFNKRQIGNELSSANQLRSTNYYEFIIRYKTDLNCQMRLIWDKKVLQIIKIIDISIKKDFQTIIAEELFINGGTS